MSLHHHHSSSGIDPTTGAPIATSSRPSSGIQMTSFADTEQGPTSTTIRGGGLPPPPPLDGSTRTRSTTQIENMDALMRQPQSSSQFNNNKDNNADDDSNSSIPQSEKLMKQEEESFYSASENDVGDDNIWGLLSGVGGNIYEWYDFAVYGLLAPEIGAAFFPDNMPKEIKLINSFGVYLAAFLMRPLGAILFGEMGDRVVGRKNALVVSILLITIPSVLMGILPTYSQWGIVAPILLVILRMMQGLSVGGQLAGSYVISIEQSSSKTRGFRGSVCDASSVGGFMLASAVTTAVRKIFTAEQVDAWAWRVPFLVSLLIAPVLYQVVHNTEESKLWSERNEQKETEKLFREAEEEQRPAVYDLFSSPFRRRQLAGMIGVMSVIASSFYIIFLWTPVYLSELRGLMSDSDADLLNFCIVGIYIFLLLFMGRMSDGFPHRLDLMKLGIPALIVACPVMFGMFESESWYGKLLGQLQMTCCLAMVEGGKAAFEVELWMADPTLSFTGVAIGHNVASTLFGGTMPLVATSLFYLSENLAGDDEDSRTALFARLIPGFYVSFLGLISWYSVNHMIRHPHDVRTGDHLLREAVERENKKYRKARKQKDKRRRELEEQLRGVATSPTEEYIPPTMTTAM